MIKHKCGNVVLPMLPEEPNYLYSIVINSGNSWAYDANEPIYIAVYSQMPFVIVDNIIVYFGTGNNLKIYQAISCGENWVFDGSPSTTQELVAFCYTSDYIWCGGGDVLRYVSATESFVPHFVYTSPIEVVAADPPEDGYAFSHSYTYLLGEQSKGLVVSSSSLDGGVLSFAWHKKVNNKDGGVVGTDSVFYPPTDKIGTSQYYCIITNNLNDTRTSRISAIDAVVTVIESIHNKGVIIGYVLELLGIPCGREIGLRLDDSQNTEVASTYTMRRTTLGALVPCMLDEALSMIDIKLSDEIINKIQSCIQQEWGE